MSNPRQIPIRNVYYLLSYAWNRLEEGELTAVETQSGVGILDLLARVLANGTAHLIRRGMGRGYIETTADIRGLRGRLDFSETVKRQLAPLGRLHCRYDELSYDTLPNRIIKSTLWRLARAHCVDQQSRELCGGMCRRLDGIEVIPVSGLTFRAVQIGSQSKVYGFLIDLCTLVNQNLFVSEETGRTRFRDFTKDRRQMERLFEDFVRNFYAREQAEFSTVGSEKISWDAVSLSEHGSQFLPGMRTDVSLRSKNRHMIIDTKYYYEALQSNYDRETVHSANLYQMHAYLANTDCSSGTTPEGMLLYPTVEYDLDLRYVVRGYPLRVATVNLADDWRSIHERLISLLESVATVSNPI